MIKNWFLGRLPEWFVQWMVLPVAGLTFFGGVWLAAHRIPHEGEAAQRKRSRHLVVANDYVGGVELIVKTDIRVLLRSLREQGEVVTINTGKLR